MVRDAGLAEMVKSEGTVTIRVMLVVWVRLPLVAVMMIG